MSGTLKLTPEALAAFPSQFIEYIELGCLQTASRQFKRHTERKLEKLANFITVSKVITPLLINKLNQILSGHARYEVCKRMGFEKIPVIRLEHMDENLQRAFILAENQFAAYADIDKSLVAEEIQYLLSVVGNYNLDIADLGFTTGEIDFYIGKPEIGDAGADLQPPAEELVTTKLGDLWHLGLHRLFCGDSRSEASFDVLCDGLLAAMVFSDPPYNVQIGGHAGGKGSIHHPEFAMASGEMSDQQFQEFLYQSFDMCRRYTVDGSIHFVCMDWRHHEDIGLSARKAGYELKNICVWVKDIGGMGSLYRSRHELVFVYKSGAAKHINNIELGKHGRNRTNVWEAPGVNSFNGRQSDLLLHPTVKPVSLVADAIMDCSNRGDIILDPFGGSGTTLVAAEQTSRVARLIEISPQYCDVIIRRWQTIAGKEALHGKTGKSFNQTAADNSHIEGDK